MKSILVMCLCATACTTVPAPSEETGPPDPDTPDAAAEKVCVSIGNWQNMSAAARFDADGLNSQVSYWAYIPGAGGKQDAFGTFGYALTSRDLNFPVQLGKGSNAEWRTSTHAMLFWRGCDSEGCEDGPYYSADGISVFSQIAGALNDPFAAKFYDVRFERVAFREDGNFDYVAGSPCYVLPRWTVAGLASTAGNGGGGGSSSNTAPTEGSAASTAAADDGGVPDAP